MDWLVRLLIDATRSIVASFVVDALNLINNIFLDLLSCDLDLFQEMFPMAKKMYSSIIVPTGVAILLLILLWRLFASMFGKMGTNSEEPLQLVFRSMIALVMLLYAKKIVNYILKFAGTPYDWIINKDVTIGHFSELTGKSDDITNAIPIDMTSVMIILTIMQFIIAWNYFKLIYTVAERYVLLGVMAYTAPLAFATGGSKSTNRILSSWCSMFGGQVVLIILDAWGLKLFLSGYGAILGSSYGFQKYFAACLCLVGFSKVIQKLDTYLASLGVSMGRSAGGMSGFTVAMLGGRMASRMGKGIFGRGGGSGGTGQSAGAGAGSGAGTTASASEGASAEAMMQSAPIPMGVDMPEQSNQESKMDMPNENDEMLNGMDMSGFDEDIGDVSGEPDGFNDSIPEAEISEGMEEGGSENIGFGDEPDIGGFDGTDDENEGIAMDSGTESSYSGEMESDNSVMANGGSIPGMDMESQINQSTEMPINSEQNETIQNQQSRIPQTKEFENQFDKIPGDTEITPTTHVNKRYHAEISEEGTIAIDTTHVTDIPRKEDVD